MSAPKSDDTPEIAKLEIERRTIAKVTARTIPILLLAFIISYIDRVNVGFAGITANRDLGLTPEMYGFGAGLALLSYSLFELPSNLAMEKFGARMWLARIMITWGLIGCAMVLVNGPWTFYLVRFLLGAAEAGLFPGVILYLTYWYPKRHRSKPLALFALGIPAASVIGSPISGAIMEMDGFLGVKGWHWLYVLEALPAVVLGVIVLIFLTDRPHQAKWLTAEEKDWLQGELDREKAQHTEVRHRFAWRMLGDSRVLVLAAVFFLTGVPSYGLSFWLPLAIKATGLTTLQTGFVTALPFACGCVAMIIWGKRSDQKRERVWHTFAGAALAFVGLACGAYAREPVLQLAAICVSAVGIYSIKGPVLALISESLQGENAAAGIALVSTLGSLSGFAAPWMVGKIKTLSGGYEWPLIVLGVQSLLGGLLLLAWARKHRPAVASNPLPVEP
jgi:MFS family permease